MSNRYFKEKTVQFFDDLEFVKKSTTNPMERIGAEVKRDEISPTPDIVKPANGKKVGNVTKYRYTNEINMGNGLQGKDVKNISQFLKMSMPLIRAANCQYYKSQAVTEYIDHTLSITRDIALGQPDDVRRTASTLLPFNDRLSTVYSPVRYIETKKYVLSYPIVTDNLVDFENYNDPDALDSPYAGGHFRDGTIEPLGIRNSFANANTSNPNIPVYGIKGSFMPYHQEQADWSDSKGSSQIDDKIEIETGAYDWFEDAQDLAFSENVFGRISSPNNTSSDNFFSLWGYVSDGKYLFAPFVDQDVDKKYFKNQYRQMSEVAASDLLKNSSKTLSSIGSRFKSSNCGHIMLPKKDSIFQTVLGTDSYAFAGLTRS